MHLCKSDRHTEEPGVLSIFRVRASLRNILTVMRAPDTFCGNRFSFWFKLDLLRAKTFQVLRKLFLSHVQFPIKLWREGMCLQLARSLNQVFLYIYFRHFRIGHTSCENMYYWYENSIQTAALIN